MQNMHNNIFKSQPIASESAILPEQSTMAASSNSSAVAVYCAASLGKQKAFQLAALCTSSWFIDLANALMNPAPRSW